MNIVREGFVAPHNRFYDTGISNALNTPMLIDPQVASNIHQTLTRMHNSKRGMYVSMWRIIITVAFFVVLGLGMYISRYWKLSTEATTNDHSTHHECVMPENKPTPPPFQEFNNKTSQPYKWSRKHDWSM